MAHLKVWGRKTSSNVQALMWCIEELNLKYERIDAGHIYGGTTTPAFLKMNPNATIPVLQDGDMQPVWETGAILRYLARVYGTFEFWPHDPALNANVDKWAEWAKINIALNFTAPIFWRVVRTKPSEHEQDAIHAAILNLEKHLAIADAQLAKTEFLAGDAFTLADIQFGHCLFRYFDIDIIRAEHVHVERYYTALTQRNAYREHVMINYEELRLTD